MWGGLEITLGAMMHMMRIPFAGVWFAAAATVLLMAGHRVLPQHGFFVRAGMICMILKTMSAGGSIVWVMIAIAIEASILEVLIGGSRAGKIRSAIAGSLVTLSVLFQLLLFTLIVYGFDMLRLYTALLRRATMWMGISESWGWGAISLLVLAIALIGAAAGVYGTMLGNAVARRRRVAV